MNNPVVLRVVAKVFIPFILLFALYVQFHGDFGPGGGFQAGVIFGVAFVLYSLIFGPQATRRVLPEATLRLLAAAGLLLYIGTGAAAFFLGGTFLDYDVLATAPHAGQHLGILLVELGVGITVFAVVVSVFLSFALRAQP
jgi:multicomponent Na+:H+ antiporter subunit B